MTTRRVRFGDAARTPLVAGCTTFARLLAPTLGPLGRTVVVESVRKPGTMEVLASAALIARRTFRLPDPFENAGAMLLRHQVWRVYEEAGDGTATTAVLASRLLRELARLLDAGLTPTELLPALDRSEACIRTVLEASARPVDDLTHLAGLVAPLGLPDETTFALLESLEAVGPEGIVLVDPDSSTDVRVELVQGVQWQSRVLAPELLPTTTGAWQLIEPRIVLTDWELTEAEHVVPLLECCTRARIRSLLLVAGELAGNATAVLATNLARGILQQFAAVAAPSVGLQQTRILEDLAALTGGIPIRRQAGERPADLRIQHLGSARQALVTRWTFAILGGRGERVALRRRIALAEAELAAAEDEESRRRARERLARLRGAYVHLRVGAATPTEREFRLAMLERLSRTLQVALARGLVPGAGASLAVAARALAHEATDASAGTRAVFRAVQQALLEPLRVLLANAGRDPAPIVHRTLSLAPALVYDLCADRWVDPWSTGLLDPLGVLEAAVGASWSLARSFLTTDVLVHRTWPASSAEP